MRRMVKKVEKWSRHHVTTEKEQRNSRSTHEVILFWSFGRSTHEAMVIIFLYMRWTWLQRFISITNWKSPREIFVFSSFLRMLLSSLISTMWKLRLCSNNGGWVATTILLGECHKQSIFFWLWNLVIPSSVFWHLKQHQICLDFPWKLAMVITDRTKHRKNCECCPGHYLSTSVY